MNLTWHIVKKDLRALKWPLLMWVLIIIAKLGVGVILLTADGTEPAEWFTRMDGMSKLLAALEGVSFVLVAALVQEDLLVGTKSFWVTRPISGGRLLRAKLWFIGLIFLLLPLLLTLPWWRGCGYGLREIGWAALETATIHAACVLLGLLWAVVTDGFARFLMWTLVTLFAVPTLTGTLAYYVSRGQPKGLGDLTATRFTVAVILAVTGIIVVVVHQYLTRRTWRSITVIGITAGLIMLVGACWSWNWNVESRVYSFLLLQAQGEWPVATEPAGLRFAVESAHISLPATSKGNSRGGFVRIKYQVDGLSKTQALMPYWAEHSWNWADGTTEQGRTWSRSGMAELMSEKTLDVAMKSPGNDTYTDTVIANAGVTHAIGTRLLAEPPTYTLKARLRLMRFDSATPMPRQPGPWFRDGVVGERVTQVEKLGQELHVTYIRHTPSLLVDNAGGGPAPRGNFIQYLLVNRARDFVDRGRAIARRSTRIGTVDITWYTMQYHGIKNALGLRPTLEAINALNDAELVKVTFVEQARFTHELKADPLVIEVVNP